MSVRPSTTQEFALPSPLSLFSCVTQYARADRSPSRVKSPPTKAWRMILDSGRAATLPDGDGESDIKLGRACNTRTG